MHFGFTGDKMILNLGCVEFYVVMTVVIVLVLIPVVAWIIKRQMMKSKKDGNQQTAVPPLMYITTVSSTDRLADIDIPVSDSLYHTTVPYNVLQTKD